MADNESTNWLQTLFKFLPRGIYNLVAPALADGDVGDFQLDESANLRTAETFSSMRARTFAPRINSRSQVAAQRRSRRATAQSFRRRRARSGSVAPAREI